MIPFSITATHINMPKSQLRRCQPTATQSPNGKGIRRRYEPTPEPEPARRKERSNSAGKESPAPIIKEEKESVIDGRFATPPITANGGYLHEKTNQGSAGSSARAKMPGSVMSKKAYITPAYSASPVGTASACSTSPSLSPIKRKREYDYVEQVPLKRQGQHPSPPRQRASSFVPFVSEDTPDIVPNKADELAELPEGTVLIDRFLIRRVFGRGSFSICYGALDLATTKEVAIKRFHPEWNMIGENEASNLAYLTDTTHIVQFIEAFWTEIGGTKCFHIVLEALATQPQLALPTCRCLERHESIACPTRHRALADIVMPILSGLAVLHHQELIHGDLTPSNILQQSEGQGLKIIDLSNAITKTQRRMYEDDYNVQTACYRAPEMLLGSGPVGNHIDVWSVGVIALELLFGGQVTIHGGIEGAELLRSPVEGRDALVRRLIDVFGSVRMYEGGKFWREAYGDLSIRWGWQKGHGKIELGENTGALPKILSRIENPKLQRFLEGLVDVDYTQRLTVDRALRDPWLIESILGVWGKVLTSAWQCGDIDGDEAETRREERRCVKKRRTGSPEAATVRNIGVQVTLSPPASPKFVRDVLADVLSLLPTINDSEVGWFADRLPDEAVEDEDHEEVNLVSQA
ncbi:kinase-like domain-containing protein [Sphaerosporella brunnea]|uniref:Kinase-like domain-containing protein n=1 Tax=Sphaerosporella brunnea TaxID=1250544 RepID=A0A5J5F3X1_9PEZI|nr:kinase-like domain-containing protein [Sphaerosporella brunnea]